MPYADPTDVGRIKSMLAREGRAEAARLCAAWIRSAKRADVKAKRERIGREMGLVGSDDADRDAEEARRARLYSCPMHIFDMTGIERAAGKIPPRLICVMCDEWMPTIEAAAYARGFAAAGGDPETVIEGFGR